MANVITFLRIPLAIAMLFVAPFSVSFWSLYVCSGFTDIIDGMVARKLNQESSFGAKLDSIADCVFVGAIVIFVVINVAMPVGFWICVLGIALLRFVCYGIGFYKYHTFVALHTYANKITGVLLFMAPVIYSVCGLTVMSVTLSGMAFSSAIEELIIVVKSKKLNRNCKSIFFC